MGFERLFESGKESPQTPLPSIDWDGLVGKGRDAPSAPIEQLSEDDVRMQEPDLVRVKGIRGLSKNQEDNGSDEANQARFMAYGTLRSALRDGEPQWFTVNRREKGGALSYELSDAMRPAHAIVDEVSEPTDTESPKEEFHTWMRVSESVTGMEEGGEMPDDPLGYAGSLGVEHILEDTDEPFEIVIRAIPVSDEDLHKKIKMVKEVRDSHKDSGGANHIESFRVNALRDNLESSETLGSAVERDIVVGSNNPETAKKVARILADRGLGGERQRWAVPPEVYDNKFDALNSNDGLDRILPASLFAASTIFPKEDVPGFKVTPAYHFSSGRGLPKGAGFMEVAHAVDNHGTHSPLEMTESELLRHSLVLGSTGSGKSTLLEEMAIAGVKKGYERWEKGEGDIISVVYIDPEKGGEEDLDLANRLAGFDMPDEFKVVRTINIGDEDGTAILNPFGLPGVPVKEMSKFVTGIFSTRFGQDRGEAQEVFQKWGVEIIERAYKDLGWDIKSGKPMRGMLETPPHPDTDQFMSALLRVMDSESFSADLRKDLGTFMYGSVREARSGLAGQSITGGMDIDWQKILETPGITKINMGAMTDPTDKRILQNIAYKGLFGQLKESYKPSGGKTPLRQIIITDEAGRVYTKDKSGGENAQIQKLIRQFGGAVVAAAQDDLENWHPDALSNMQTTFAGIVIDDTDREKLASRMAGVNSEDLEYLSSMPDVKNINGSGLFYTVGMNKPVRFKTHNPHDMERGEGKLVGAEDIIDNGDYKRAYDIPTKSAAHSFLTDDPVGVRLRKAVEWSAAAVSAPVAENGKALKPLKIKGELKEVLQEIAQEDPDLLECAITMASKSSADARPAVGRKAPRSEFVRALDDHITNTINDTPEEIDFSKFSIKPTSGRFGRKDQESDIVMPPDFLHEKGGFITDNIIAELVKYSNPSDAILGSFGDPRPSLIESMKSGSQEGINRWADRLKQELFSDPDIEIDPDTTKYLWNNIIRLTKDLYTKGQDLSGNKGSSTDNNGSSTDNNG